MDRSKTSYALLTRTENTTSDCVNELTKKIPNERKPKTKKTNVLNVAGWWTRTLPEASRIVYANERMQMSGWRKGEGPLTVAWLAEFADWFFSGDTDGAPFKRLFRQREKLSCPFQRLKKKIMCDKIETKRKRHERRFFFFYCFVFLFKSHHLHKKEP